MTIKNIKFGEKFRSPKARVSLKRQEKYGPVIREQGGIVTFAAWNNLCFILFSTVVFYMHVCLSLTSSFFRGFSIRGFIDQVQKMGPWSPPVHVISFPDNFMVGECAQ